MGRPPTHDVDKLLDAAAELFADGGPRAVTMAAVARACRAPSGSVYHRFASRPALLGALWLRTITRFQDGFFEAAQGKTAVEATVASGRFAVEWCRAHPAEAAVINAGKRQFEPSKWPEEVAEKVDRADKKLQREIKALVKRVRAQTGNKTDIVVLAVIDVPYAVIRRYLQRGVDVPPEAADLVEKAVRRMVAGA